MTEQLRYGYVYAFFMKPTGKYYIGQHGGDEFDFTYWGSGEGWKKDLHKFGKTDIERTVIDWGYSDTDLNEKEAFWIDHYRDYYGKDGVYNQGQGGGVYHRGYLHVRNPDTGEVTSIPPDQVDDFLATHPDWERGGTKGVNKDHRHIHNPDTSEKKTIPPDQLDEFLAKGWMCGAVNQIDKKTGKIIATFDSSHIAAQETGINENQIYFTADYFKYPKGDYDWEWVDPRWRYRNRRPLRNARKVMCIETGEIFNDHVAAAVAMATKENRINYQHIQACCKGIYKSAGGYHWKYAE